MSRAYYNEIDPFAAQWLRNLIAANLIAPGDVDERDIRDVRSSDLRGYDQCHFFAGIGGWSYALRLAGWPDDRPVWTGSCPCQPFSIIGKRTGFDDERHLWPIWYNLICECSPPVILGEQVAKSKLWLDLVFSDLEKTNYACGAANIPAAGVGARHERQRLWFVADSNETRWENAQRFAAAKAGTEIGAAPSVVYSLPPSTLRGAFKPDDSWIVDGLFGEGLAVSALGNSIVPQVAKAFIQAYMEASET